MASDWNPAAFAEEMKKSTLPVSAFYLIDSPRGIEACVRELQRLLGPYGEPPHADTAYFREVRDIYEAGREVLNMDVDVPLRWKGHDCRALVRYHSVDTRQYEIELWLPGVIAAEVHGLFSDGRSGFFCAFMPPSFYD